MIVIRGEHIQASCGWLNPAKASPIHPGSARSREGDNVRIFNGRDGEWRAMLYVTGRRGARLDVKEKIREPALTPDITLLFAPVRKHRTAFIIEKGTELGVRRFQPVLTARTQFPRLNVERARLQAIEAAEQTERLDIPKIDAARPLLDVLAAWDGTPIIFADEAGDAQPAKEVCAKLSAPVAILIGPEGGFTDAERAEGYAALMCHLTHNQLLGLQNVNRLTSRPGFYQ